VITSISSWWAGEFGSFSSFLNFSGQSLQKLLGHPFQSDPYYFKGKDSTRVIAMKI